MEFSRGSPVFFAESLDAAIAGPASRFVQNQQQSCLSDAVGQLAGLRFAIILSAGWESSSVLAPSARAELREELRQFRLKYNSKLDEIAMNFGVQAAIDAKEGVEREVKVPKNMAPPLHADDVGYHDI